MSVRVSIATLSGQDVLQADFDGSDVFRSILGRVAERLNVSSQSLRLAYGGRLLTPELLLFDVFGGESSVHLSVVVMSSSARVLTISPDLTLRTWNAFSGDCEHTLQGHRGDVTSAVVSPDGARVLSGALDNTARLWCVESGDCVGQLGFRTSRERPGTVISIAFLPDAVAVVFVALPSGIVELWNVETGEKIQTLTGHEQRVLNAVLSRCGTLIVTVSLDGDARLWARSTGECIRTLHCEAAIYGVVISSDGSSILTDSFNGAMRLWSAATGEFLRLLIGSREAGFPVAFSHDCTRVVAACGAVAKLWCKETGAVEQSFKGHTRGLLSIAISSESRLLLTGSVDQTAKLWRLSSGDCLRTFCGHSERVCSAVLSEDQFSVLTASDDSTAVLWCAETGERLQTLSAHASSVRLALFLP